MSQVTNNSNNVEPCSSLFRFADAITLGAQEPDGRLKILSFGEKESMEKRMEKLKLFTEEHASALSTTKKDHKEKDYKLREVEGIAGDPRTLESRLYSIALSCIQEMATDYERRVKVTPETLNLLNAGVFYGNTYLQLLLDLQKKKLSEKNRIAIEKILKIHIEKGSFFHGHAPSKYFKHENDPTSSSGKAITKYLLKDKSISPSAALDAVISKKELIFLDCGTACQIAYYEALRAILGKDKFDAIFAYDGPTPFVIGAVTRSDPLLCLIQDVPYSQEACVEGAWIFVLGPRFYGAKHLNGEGQNWNALLGDPKNEKFFGLGLKPKGETFEDIEKTFLREYNADPVGMKGVTPQVAAKIESTYSSAFLRQAKSLENHRITLEELRESGKVQRLFVRKLDMGKIEKLKDASTEEARLLMATWKEALLKLNMGISGHIKKTLI